MRACLYILAATMFLFTTMRAGAADIRDGWGGGPGVGVTRIRRTARSRRRRRRTGFVPRGAAISAPIPRKARPSKGRRVGSAAACKLSQPEQVQHPRPRRGRARRARLGRAVAVQIGAVRIEPGLGPPDVRTKLVHQPPEFRRMVHLDEMRDLVRRQIVEHERRREDQAPGERQHAGGRARAPAARLDRGPRPA